MRNMMRRLAVASALVLGLGLTAGCGGDDGTTEASSGGGGGGAFPVTVTHKLGEATIESEPERIVALGEVDQDTLLALGVQPVGMTKLPGVQDDGMAPWSAPKVSGDKPKLLAPGESGFNLEEIAALRPDLILAAGDFWIDQQYEKLSQLAPTVAYQVGPAQDSWQQITVQAATAIGRKADGEKLVADVEKQITAVESEHPELQGKGFAFNSVLPSGNIAVMKDLEDTSVKLLNQFGMELPEEIAKLPGESFHSELSMEQVSVLDVDVLISHYNDDPAMQKKIEESELFSSLAVVERGSYVPLNLQEFWPLRTPTPLAVPYVVDNVVPKIAEAAAKAESA